MSDYAKLVKDLRSLANGTWGNSEYTWFGDEGKVFADAAAAIEELQSENMDLFAEVQDLEMRVENLAGELAAEEDGRMLDAELNKKRTANCWGCNCPKMEDYA